MKYTNGIKTIEIELPRKILKRWWKILELREYGYKEIK